jgi:putative ABC transport system ATP-binding protein
VSTRFTKGRETISVFNQLDLSIPRRDFVAVMGPSGSGKTAPFNILDGIDRIDCGEVTVAGRRIDGLSEGELARWRAANIGFIFQFYNLMPMLIAAQNVELPLLLTKPARKERAERVSTALSVVRLADRLKHYPREMSGGQQQRVANRSAVRDPAAASDYESRDARRGGAGLRVRWLIRDSGDWPVVGSDWPDLE